MRLRSRSATLLLVLALSALSARLEAPHAASALAVHHSAGAWTTDLCGHLPFLGRSAVRFRIVWSTAGGASRSAALPAPVATVRTALARPPLGGGSARAAEREFLEFAPRLARMKTGASSSGSTTTPPPVA